MSVDRAARTPTPTAHTRTAHTRTAHTWATTDIDEARVFMSGQFMGHVPTVRGHDDGFRLRVSSADHGPFGRHALTHRATVDSSSDPYDGYLVGRLLGGRARFQQGSTDVRLSAGGVYVYPQGSALTTTWEGVSVDTVLLSAAVLADAAQGLGVPAPLVFDSVTPVSTELANHWNRTTDYVDEVAASVDLARHPLIAHQLAWLLASVMLTTFPLRTAAPRVTETRVSSRALRRAIDYIEAHADEPIGLRDLAAASGVGPRALQQAFRSQLDASPIEYARRIRLERAHHDLLVGDPDQGDTVATIAARWGFVHLGRFAADHHSVYGLTPRAVLHN